MTRLQILPPLARTAADAEHVARVIHDGQVDKAGRPYIEHVAEVERRTSNAMCVLGHLTGSAELDEARQIAWLHDVLESDDRPFGAISRASLWAEDFADSVVEGAALLASKDQGDYASRIGWLTETAPLSVLLVKFADLEDNSDPARLALLPPDKAKSLAKRYEPAKARIRRALAERFGATLPPTNPT